MIGKLPLLPPRAAKGHSQGGSEETENVGETRKPLHCPQSWHDRKKQTEAKIALFCFVFLLPKSRSERKGSRKQAAWRNRIAWRFKHLGHLLCKTHKSITCYKQGFFSLWPLAHNQNSGANIHYNCVSYKELWNDIFRPFMINNNT